MVAIFLRGLRFILIFDEVSSILIFDKRGGCLGKKKKGLARKDLGKKES